MFPRDPDKVMNIQINLLLFCLEGLLLAGVLHCVTSRGLDAQFRFSFPLSLLVAGIWMLLSLSGFLYVTPASLLGLGVSGTWLRYTILLLVILTLTGRYLVSLPWGVAAACAAISSAMGVSFPTPPCDRQVPCHTERHNSCDYIEPGFVKPKPRTSYTSSLTSPIPAASASGKAKERNGFAGSAATSWCVYGWAGL